MVKKGFVLSFHSTDHRISRLSQHKKLRWASCFVFKTVWCTYFLKRKLILLSERLCNFYFSWMYQFPSNRIWRFWNGPTYPHNFWWSSRWKLKVFYQVFRKVIFKSLLDFYSGFLKSTFDVLPFTKIYLSILKSLIFIDQRMFSFLGGLCSFFMRWKKYLFFLIITMQYITGMHVWWIIYVNYLHRLT